MSILIINFHNAQPLIFLIEIIRIIMHRYKKNVMIIIIKNYIQNFKNYLKYLINHCLKDKILLVNWKLFIPNFLS